MNRHKERIDYLAQSYIAIAQRYRNWNLVKELSDILKEIKPSSKSLKIAREKIDKCIEQDKRNN